MSTHPPDAEPGVRGWLLLVVAVALLHAALFMAHQRPDWSREDVWSDQEGYSRLGHVVATTGTFTRYPGEQPFIPETIRTPGYPVFLAGVYTVLGESHAAVAAAQAVLFALEAIAIFFLTLRLASVRVARAAALATAIYPPLPYFAALTLTETLTTFFVTIGVWRAVAAAQDGRRLDFVVAGLAIGAATLTRPTFVLLPFVLIGAAALAERGRLRAIAPWGFTLTAFAVVLAPWLLYTAVYVHRVTLSPAGGIGRGIWEASWQGTWPGRVQAELTTIAQSTWYAHASADEVAAEVRRTAAGRGADADLMVTYVRQWQDVRRIWDTTSGPRERGQERIAADQEYLRVGLENIRRDPVQYLVRRLPYRVFILWAGDIPVRYSLINSLPPLLIRAMWLAQALLVALSLWGLLVLVNRGHATAAAIVAGLIGYLTVIHVPLLAESRYTLPAKPIVLALATIALAELAHRVLPQTGDYLP
ncbi:MAG: glycosyltransferase family 39 protein [Vicinamibacterales bacterium]